MNASKTKLTMGCLWEKWKTGKWRDVNDLGRNKNRKTEGEVHRRRQLYVNVLLLNTLIYPCGEPGNYRSSLCCVCMCDRGAKPCDIQACTTAAPATRASMYDTVWLPENIKPELVAWEAKYWSGAIDLGRTTVCVSECSNWRFLSTRQPTVFRQTTGETERSGSLLRYTFECLNLHFPPQFLST